MSEIVTDGLGLAKNVFQVLQYFGQLPAWVVAMDARLRRDATVWPS